MALEIDEIRFPEIIARGYSGGPAFQTLVVEAAPDSPHESSEVRWSVGRWYFELDDPNRDPAETTELLEFFYCRWGRAYGFRFKDWNDFRATNEDLGTASGDQLQLVKTYTSGGVDYVRTIYKPVSPTVTLKKNGVPFVDFEVDYNSGTVFLIPGSYDPGDEFSWTGEFDVPVRFDIDQMELSQDDAEVRSWNSIAIVELLGAPEVTEPEFNPLMLANGLFGFQADESLVDEDINSGDFIVDANNLIAGSDELDGNNVNGYQGPRWVENLFGTLPGAIVDDDPAVLGGNTGTQLRIDEDFYDTYDNSSLMVYWSGALDLDLTQDEDFLVFLSIQLENVREFVAAIKIDGGTAYIGFIHNGSPDTPVFDVPLGADGPMTLVWAADQPGGVVRFYKDGALLGTSTWTTNGVKILAPSTVAGHYPLMHVHPGQRQATLDHWAYADLHDATTRNAMIDYMDTRLNNGAFATPATPVLSAGAVTESTIDLSWTQANAYFNSRYIIERSPDGVGSWSQVGTNVPYDVTFTDTGRTTNTTYYYRVKSVSDMFGTESAYSNVANATTAVLNTPTNLVATAVNDDQIDLTWTDNTTQEDDYRIERSLTGVGGWSEIATNSANDTTYSDTGLDPETQYFYRVRAKKTSGPVFSAYSNIDDATTLAGAFDPYTLGNQLWMLESTGITPQADNTDLNTWPDDSVSPNNNNDVVFPSPTDGGTKPKYRTNIFNSTLPGVQFSDGDEGEMTSPFAPSSLTAQSATIYAVIDYNVADFTGSTGVIFYTTGVLFNTSGNDIGLIIAEDNDTPRKDGIAEEGGVFVGIANAVNGKQILTLILDKAAGTATLRRNGVQVGQVTGLGTEGWDFEDYITWGSLLGGLNSFVGYMAANFAFNTVHDGTTIGQVETYLNTKYDIY